MGSDSVSNRNHYLANKDDINRRKRERYKKDKKYRDAALARARAQTLLKKVSRISERATVKHSGKIEPSYTLSELSKAINRSRDVIFRWRNSGVIPKPTHIRGGKGIYSYSQLSYLKVLLGWVDQGSKLNYQDIQVILSKVWDKPFRIERASKLAMKALSKKGEKNETTKEGSSKACCRDKDEKRKDDPKKGRTGSQVRRAGGRSTSRPRRDVEHGKLRSPAPRRKPIAAMRPLTCQGRRSF